MRVMVKLENSEIQQLPYGVICMTRYGYAWNTGRRKRRWKAEFTEKEREAATKIFSMSHRFLLSTGTPDELVMSTETLLLWRKLGDFCASI